MSSAFFNRIFKLLSVIAVSAVIAQVLYLFFRTMAFALWPVILIFCAAGYGMQAVYGTVTGTRHKSRAGYGDETGYESGDTPFSLLRAAGPLTVSVIITLLLYRPYDELFLTMTRIIPEIIYSEDSAYPFLMLIVTFIGLGAGVVLWFYPAHRIISLRRMATFIPIMWIVYLIALFMGIPTDPMAVFLLVFSVCAFIVLNQLNIQRGVKDTLTVITNKGRFYNLKLIMFVLISMLVIVIVMAAIVTGVMRIAQIILLMVISASVNGASASTGEYSGYNDLDTIYENYGNLLGAHQPVGEHLLFVLFIVLFIGALFLMITRGTDITKRFIARVREWFSELFMFFMDAWHYNGVRGREPEDEFLNYRDEEIKLRNAEIHDYEKRSVTHANSYKEFISRLNSFSTYAEKLRFAYVALMASYRSRGMGNRLSETPREARCRIESRTNEYGLARITNAIEAIDYKEAELTESESHEAIAAMCGIIEKHYNA